MSHRYYGNYRRNSYKSYRPRRRRFRPGRFIVFILIIIAIVAAVFFAWRYFSNRDKFGEENPNPTPTPEAYVEEPVTLPEEVEDSIVAAPTANTQPSNFGFQTDIMVGGNIVDSFSRDIPIMFPTANEYTNVQGITTFRGNNYRNMSSYGAVNVTENDLEIIWERNTGALTKWSGSGYPSQPIIVQWSDEMRSIMNIKEEKKSKSNLVEAIYATMDGNIYFIDVEDGKPTRDPINMGVSVKGTASLDPRGYPLLYVGQGVGDSGDYSYDGASMMIYSLIDQAKLFDYSYDTVDNFAHRTTWQAFDSSPLISAEADTLIWPGENGVLYTFKLNSDFDIGAASVSVSPEEPVKYRYTTPNSVDGPKDADTSSEDYQSESAGSRWYGIENSAAAYKNYLYFTDNGGWMQCVDLNTMELVWAQDVTDDTDASLVIDDEGENVSIYTGCEVDKAAASGAETGSCYIRKINALNGEIIWEKDFTCFVHAGVDGGLMATPIIGRGDLDGMVIFNIARTGDSEDEGLMIAYDKNTGEEIWRTKMDRYCWSSPCAVYSSEGKGYIIQGNSGGDVMLIDGKTGEILATVDVGSNVEASPAVYGDMIVVGTRGEKIIGIKIK